MPECDVCKEHGHIYEYHDREVHETTVSHQMAELRHETDKLKANIIEAIRSVLPF